MRQVMECLPCAKAITATKTPKRVRLIWTKEIKNQLGEEKLRELEEKEIFDPEQVRSERSEEFFTDLYSNDKY